MEVSTEKSKIMVNSIPNTHAEIYMMVNNLKRWTL
jgi:hypothetical protein